MSDTLNNAWHRGESVEVAIEEINNLGSGVGHAPDGRVVFVRGALTGERVRATVIKVASSFYVARLDGVLTPSPLMAITTYGHYSIEDLADFVVYVPKTDPHFLTSLAIIPLQLLAYYIATAKGRNVDQPRNLAKSVTVE